MLSYVGFESLDQLSAAVVPESIRMFDDLDLPPALDEPSVLNALRGLARRNTVLHSLIGQGYYGCVLPAVIQRNVLESPAWYTAYTPYQPEISQGRLEALLNFQTLVEDLTGLPIAGSSLLDEPTAAAEAMTVLLRTHKGDSRVFLVDSDTHPQTLAVLRTRALPVDIELVEFDADGALPVVDAFGVLLSYPGSSGCIRDLGSLVATAHERGFGVAATTDLLALTMLTPPGEWGADVVVGSAQRFGVPFGFGGPHAGFMSVRSGLERSMPGRLVGVSVDADGKPAMLWLCKHASNTSDGKRRQAIFARPKSFSRLSPRVTRSTMARLVCERSLAASMTRLRVLPQRLARWVLRWSTRTSSTLF